MTKKPPGMFRIGRIHKVLEKINERSKSSLNESERINSYFGLNEPMGMAKRAEFRVWEEARSIIEAEFKIGNFADLAELEEEEENE